MKKLREDFPLSIKISFKKVFDKYRSLANSKENGLSGRVAQVLAISEKYPKLTKGIETESEFEEYKDQIDFVLEDLFAPLLDLNEIKTATIPFQEFVFKSTQRYKDIIKAAGKDYQIQMVNFDDHNSYIMACSIILNMYYGYKADFRRPFSIVSLMPKVA